MFNVWIISGLIFVAIILVSRGVIYETRDDKGFISKKGQKSFPFTLQDAGIYGQWAGLAGVIVCILAFLYTKYSAEDSLAA